LKQVLYTSNHYIWSKSNWIENFYQGSCDVGESKDFPNVPYSPLKDNIVIEYFRIRLSQRFNSTKGNVNRRMYFRHFRFIWHCARLWRQRPFAGWIRVQRKSAIQCFLIARLPSRGSVEVTKRGQVWVNSETRLKSLWQMKSSNRRLETEAWLHVKIATNRSR
jgi:hypothetical protein